MQVVWEADTAAFASRKRAARACISCQKKKKRCAHTFSRPPDQQAEVDGLDRVLPNLTHKEPIRFVGDLNPESILSDLSSTKGLTRPSRIGTWVEQSKQQAEELRLRAEELAPPKSGEKTPNNVEKYGKVEGGKRTLTAHYRNYLQAVGAFRVLPKATQDALVTTYVACIADLLPIVGESFLKDYANGNASIFLVQAICLVTCKTPEVSSYLRLYEDGPLLDPIPFARSLHTGLDAAMKADLEPNRVTKIQILTLMHLHNDGPGGIEDSSQHLAQAIHDAWTAGLHIDTPGRTRKDDYSLLWWVLWTLDRINACIGGRPIMIADRDIDIGRPPLEEGRRLQNITVWVRLGDLLDQVIEFYRPIGDPDTTGWETEFPSWASMIEGIDTDSFVESHLVILELCYQIIAILSCRAGGPGTNSYERRISAADRIQLLLSDDWYEHGPPLPLVPYAISLSLTVAYRGLRDHYADSDTTTKNLSARCEMLEGLNNYWWTADAMAKLGRKALKSMQQPGTKKSEQNDLVNAMDAEVAACKFGPFKNHSPIPGDRSSEKPDSTPIPRINGTPTSGNITSGKGGNALHLLSDAAAARASNNTSASSNSTSTTVTSYPMPSTRMRMPSLSSNPIPNLMYSQHHSLINFHYPPAPPQPSTTPLSQPPLSFSPGTTTSTSNTPKPGASSLHDTSNSIASTLAGYTLAPTTTSIDATSFDPHNNAYFNDLDNLFDGFFDLSMPTLFQDPLFNGAAFMDGGMDDDMGNGYGFDVDGQKNMAMNVGMGAAGAGLGLSAASGGVGAGMGMGLSGSGTGTGSASLGVMGGGQKGSKSTTMGKPRGGTTAYPDLL